MQKYFFIVRTEGKRQVEERNCKRRMTKREEGREGAREGRKYQ